MKSQKFLLSTGQTTAENMHTSKMFANGPLGKYYCSDTARKLAWDQSNHWVPFGIIQPCESSGQTFTLPSKMSDSSAA